MSMEDMEHREADESLDAFRDGELPPGEAERVRAHAERCAECRGRLALWESASRRLLPAVPERRSEAFVRRVLARVERPAERPSPRLELALAFSAAALLLSPLVPETAADALADEPELEELLDSLEQP